MMRSPRLAAAGLGLFLLRGCGSGSQTTTADAGTGSTVVATTAPAAKGTALSGHTLNGVLTVMMSDDIAKGAACQPPAPYDDLTAGAPVVVKNAAGNRPGGRHRRFPNGILVAVNADDHRAPDTASRRSGRPRCRKHALGRAACSITEDALRAEADRIAGGRHSEYCADNESLRIIKAPVVNYEIA
jgi:hypothetical protein